MSRIKIAFVAAFFTFSILPVFEWMTGLVYISPLQENRRLAPPPDFAATLWRGDGRLADAINNWFDDRYGFRALFIRLKNQLDYWVFRHSDKVLIGHDGWLYSPEYFDGSTGLISAERAGDAGAARVHRRFLAMARYLKDRGIRLIVIGNPNKESTYPQFLPRGIPHVPRNNRFQQLRVWLKSRPEFDYVDGVDVLARCRGWRTFSYMDIHMTMPGGVCFTEALVARIAKDEGRAASPWDHSFTYGEMRSTAGGLNEFLSLLFPLRQPAYTPNHTYDVDHDPSVTRDPAGVFEWIYRAPPGEDKGRLPAVVLYGDSFLDHYREAGIQNYLSAAYRIRDNGHNLPAVLQNLPADAHYFVFEFLEHWVNAIALQRIPEHKAAHE